MTCGWRKNRQTEPTFAWFLVLIYWEIYMFLDRLCFFSYCAIFLLVIVHANFAKSPVSKKTLQSTTMAYGIPKSESLFQFLNKSNATVLQPTGPGTWRLRHTLRSSHRIGSKSNGQICLLVPHSDNNSTARSHQSKPDSPPPGRSRFAGGRRNPRADREWRRRRRRPRHA